MSNFNAKQYKALIFDVYATLIDWQAGIWARLHPMLERINSPLANSKGDAFKAFFSVQDDLWAKYPKMLYPEVLATAFATLEARLKNEPSPLHSGSATSGIVTTSGVPESSITPAESSGRSQLVIDSYAKAFGDSIPDWPPFTDSIAALQYLSTIYKLTVLSNVDRASFAGTQKLLETSDPEHQFKFTAIYTAEEIGSYKPDPANLRYALKKLKDDYGVEKDEVLVVAASLPHDHVPANALGLAGIFIDREGAEMNEGIKVTYNAAFPTLGAFAGEVKKQLESS
ncbi:HAD-like domain-containing protein [Abortiporus biennis]|nr:HAD-like domain-containing protein [Abortiporus biennis]